jgi:hypothetical protein
MKSHHCAERRRSLLTGVLAITVFLVLHPDVLAFYSTRFLGGSVGDGGLYVWLVQSFIKDPWYALSFESRTLYPYPYTRAWSDSFLLPSGIALVFTSVGLSLAAAYNSLVLLTFSSNAVACGLLAQRVGVKPAFAVAVGVLFANSSYLVGNLGHPQLLFFFWIPLAWWCVIPASQHGRASSRSWFVAGLCVTGAFYCAVYYAIFAVVGLALIWFRELLYGRLSPRRALRTVLFATLGAAPIICGVAPYVAVQRYFGTRGLHEASHFAATGLSYLSFSPLHEIFSATSTLSHSEAYLSPGYLITSIALITIASSCWLRSRVLTCALVIGATTLAVSSSTIDPGNRSELLLCVSSWVVLVGAIAFTVRDRSAIASFAIIAAVFLVFSFGPGGNPHKHEPAFTPLGVLFTRVPGLAAVRAVGRYGVVVIFAACITAALGLQRFITSDRRRSIEVPPAAAATLLLIFGLVENLLITIPLDAPAPPVQAFTTLASDPSARGAALVLPFSSKRTENKEEGWSKIAILNSRYALWESSSRGSRVKLVNGYSGQRSKLLMQLPRATQNFPDPTSLDYFARICGLRYIIVAPSFMEQWSNEQFDQQLQGNADAFAAVQRFEDGSLLLTLADRQISSTGGTLAPFFAPRNAPVRLRVTPQRADSCLITTTSLGKSADGQRVALQSSEYATTHEQTINLVPPAQLLSASPHLLEIRIQGCSAGVRCEVDGEWL